MLKRGTIVEFRGSWSSGLATLVVVNAETGKTESLPADSGPLGRALINAFGASGNGHTINNDAIKGEEIFYAMDDMGLTLAGFVPLHEAGEEHWEAYYDAQLEKEDK